MKLGDLRVLFWVALFLLAGEAGLEFRAHLHGWGTPLFGDRAVAADAGGSGPPGDGPAYGPTRGFPFRSAVVPREKRPGVPRIWVASASYGEDVYLPPDEIFPSRLEALLAEAGVPVEVLNASRAGMDTDANTDDLERLGADWRPDVVILYQMSGDINDLSHRLLGGTKSRDDTPPGDPAEDPANDPGEKPEADWPTRAVESTTLYAQVKANLSSQVVQQRLLADTLGDAGEAAFAHRLRRLVAACRKIGATPVLVTFAASYDRHNLARMPLGVRNGVFRYNQELSMDGWVRTIERYNRVMARVAAETGAGLVDVNAALGGKDAYFRDFVHFTPEGHKIVADTLAAALLQPPPGSPLSRLARGGAAP